MELPDGGVVAAVREAKEKGVLFDSKSSRSLCVFSPKPQTTEAACSIHTFNLFGTLSAGCLQQAAAAAQSALGAALSPGPWRSGAGRMALPRT